MQNNNTKNEKMVCPETYSISFKDIAPFLLDMNYEEVRKGVKPSIIVKELNRSCEERLQKLRSATRKYKIGTKNEAFSRCPEAIIFQRFEKSVMYSTPLTLTNRSSIPHSLKIVFETTKHYNICMDSDNHTRIAPGMSYTVQVNFLPTDKFRDYVHQIKFISDENTYTVPIYGLGPRGCLNMPDKLVLPPTLAKVPTHAVIVLKNVGEAPLPFVCLTEPPYTSSITKALVPPEGLIEVKYTCQTQKTGRLLRRSVYIKNEFRVSVLLECEIKSANVELDTHVVSFEDVFMGLTSQKIVRCRNCSDFNLNFAWKMHDFQTEIVQRQKLLKLMEDLAVGESRKCTNLEVLDVIDEEEHKDIYARILEDEKDEMEADANESFLFNSDFFEIIPKVGNILPHSIFEFSVIFTPKENVPYHCWAYLDIQGLEKRVRVSMQGSGVGPPVALVVKSLDVNQVYLTDRHQYEVAVRNTGVIPATVRYQPKKMDFGGVIECIPHSLELGPDCTKAFVLLFHSGVQGDFVETLDFVVEESGDKLYFLFSGTVICPLLNCIPDSLNYGVVSVGFTYEKTLQLVNESHVEIPFKFDMDEPLNKNNLQIVPGQGKVFSKSGIQVRLKFCCDFTTEINTNLQLTMWNSSQFAMDIPFSAKVFCAKLVCEPSVVSIKFCFLNCEYKRFVRLVNKTELAGYVEFVPLEDSSQDKNIQCIPDKSKVYFKEYESFQIGLTITTSALGLHEIPLYFAVVGGSCQQLCIVSCNGQGPVITYYPDEVQFGKVDLLKMQTHILRLVNDSPIDAKVRVYCVFRDTGKNNEKCNVSKQVILHTWLHQRCLRMLKLSYPISHKYNSPK